MKEYFAWPPYDQTHHDEGILHDMGRRVLVRGSHCTAALD